MSDARLNQMASDSAMGGGEPNAASWQEHEFLPAQLELDALRLLADAGTPELAKYAIDSVDEQQRDQFRAEVAQALGFRSYAELLAASAAVDTNDDRPWYVTLLADGQWVAWNCTDIRVDRKHSTREAALAHVENGARSNG